MSLSFPLPPLQVALKRQQAVEDAIALRLAANETGTELQTLPPGKIYGMSVTEPRNVSPSPSDLKDMQANRSSIDGESSRGTNSGPTSPSAGPSAAVAAPALNGTVSQTALDMLAQLFPHRKRSVLELVLRRCDLDLLRAIEQCSPQTQTGFGEQGMFRSLSHQVRR